ncbi:MAG TPA: TetR family transcriptional regulator C-terminal domain-containing protein [Thermoanaerobaculia bacterium]
MRTESDPRCDACLEVARECRAIPADVDTRRMASLLVDCWEGAALRSRLRATAEPLSAPPAFYFSIGLPSAIGHVNARARMRRRR